MVSRGWPCVLLLLACCWLCEAGAGLAPALYVLGDSQADAGTNNHLVTVLRAVHPHNGVDYPGCKATGRFSNGKNFVDFLGAYICLPLLMSSLFSLQTSKLSIASRRVNL